MPSIISMPSLPGPFWPGVVAPDRILSMDQIEPFDYLKCVKLTVYKQMINSK